MGARRRAADGAERARQLRAAAFEEHKPRGGLVGSVYELVRDSAAARDAAIDALIDTYFMDADPEKLLDELSLLSRPPQSVVEMAFAERTARYKDLCDRADIYWSGDRGNRYEASLSARSRRSAAAREAVLLRSGGRCENPRCTGDVQDVTDSGAPILEVDHVRDLAKGGPDKPDQMIALCPNCHATMTRGRGRQALQRELLVVTGRRHQAYLTGRSADGPFLSAARASGRYLCRIVSQALSQGYLVVSFPA